MRAIRWRRSWAGLPPTASRVTADIVTTGPHGTFPSTVRTRSIDPTGVRSIGYARLIEDGTWRSVRPGIYSHHLFVYEMGADLSA